MSDQTEEVNQFMKELDHPLKEGIEKLRAAILGSNEHITEHIKWNAPSFCYGGEDRVTFQLSRGDRIQLIFHRGAKARDSKDFVFEDRTGLLKWVAADRAVATLHDMKDVEAKQAALIHVVHQWMASTS
ncbi:MAG: DUF1801 domain-containing protein [Thermomicrobiales bacterium]